MYWSIFFINRFSIRYHFEANKNRFLPTLTFSGGRVDVSVLWPEAVEQLPAITDVWKIISFD